MNNINNIYYLDSLIYNINVLQNEQKKIFTYVGCGCCGIVINSCTTAPITDRKQLKLIPEAKLNAQAAQIYEKVKKRKINQRYEIY